MRRKKQRKKNTINETWLLPYSDLLTLLVALFIVLFSMSKLDVEKYQDIMQVFDSEFKGGSSVLEESAGVPEQHPDKLDHNTATDDDHDKDKEKEKQKKKEEAKKRKVEREKLTKMKKRVDQYISQNKLSGVLDTNLSGDGLFITISNEVSFDTGSANVKKDGEKIAKKVSGFLYTDPPHEVVVGGYTDNRPIHNSEFSSNWELSAMRSINFMQLLLKNGKLEPDQFSAKGYGPHHPVAPNDSEKNMRKNRRVEVLILPNENIDKQKDG